MEFYHQFFFVLNFQKLHNCGNSGHTRQVIEKKSGWSVPKTSCECRLKIAFGSWTTTPHQKCKKILIYVKIIADASYVLLRLYVIAFIKYRANCRPLFIVNNWEAFCLAAYQNTLKNESKISHSEEKFFTVPILAWRSLKSVLKELLSHSLCKNLINCIFEFHIEK